MTGRLGDYTTEMNGGSTASYLARTPRVPFSYAYFHRSGSIGAFRFPGTMWVRRNLRPVIFGVESVGVEPSFPQKIGPRSTKK